MRVHGGRTALDRTLLHSRGKQEQRKTENFRNSAMTMSVRKEVSCQSSASASKTERRKARAFFCLFLNIRREPNFLRFPDRIQTSEELTIHEYLYFNR